MWDGDASFIQNERSFFMQKIDISRTMKITISGIIIATYVVVMFLTQSFAFGQYQIRIATSIYALASIYPFLIVPLGLANFMSNTLMGGLGLNDYFVKFNCPEFTSLCPITGQPDFATIYISYVPNILMVESKSLKLYLFSFRNHGDFHEDCINVIMKDLINLLDPKYIEVWGKFTPRGGISIDPYCNYGKEGSAWDEVAKKRLHLHDLYPEKIDNR